MKARVITIAGHAYSESMAQRCIDSAKQFGISVERFEAVTPDTVGQIMQDHGLVWTWANMNTEKTVCPYSGLQQFPYRTRNLLTKMACSMSHYLLWRQCSVDHEPWLILEHDAVFVAPMPDIEFQGACQINDPAGGGYRSKHHSQSMIQRDVHGVHPLTCKRPVGSHVPDGFSGNSAYLVKPWAAEKFVGAFHCLGVWPNDATICIQLFPWLEELYPFVTVVHQTQSTSTV